MSRELLEQKRDMLHSYILLKLKEHDYHAVSDAANDLRELEIELKFCKPGNLEKHLLDGADAELL